MGIALKNSEYAIKSVIYLTLVIKRALNTFNALYTE
jgi:hypothetical protein